MASPTPSAAKPDWGFRIGCGLWSAIGWVTLRVLGWHIPFWLWWTVLVMGIGMFFQYFSMLEATSNAERAREIERLNARLDEMENLIANIR